MARPVPRSRRQYVSHSSALAIARAAGAKGAAFPKYIEPLLATERDRPPNAAGWIHEIKWDGYRVQLHKRDAGTFCYTRRGYDWSDRFPTIIEGAWQLKSTAAVVDGEAVVLSKRGDADFNALGPTSRAGARRGAYLLANAANGNVAGGVARGTESGTTSGSRHTHPTGANPNRPRSRTDGRITQHVLRRDREGT